MDMKILLPAAALAGGLIVAHEAHAKRINANSPASGKAFSDCAKNGGTNWPQTADNPTYGCVDKDGHGLVCGGGTAEQKSTCDTFRAVPPRWPSRDEALKAGQAEERAGKGKGDGD